MVHDGSMSRSRRDAAHSVLLVAAVLAGLLGVRWWATGALDRPMAPATVARQLHQPDGAVAPTIAAPAGTLLSLGGRQPIVVDAASGAVSPISPDPDDQTVLFRQGDYTVLVANQRAWSVRAGWAGPRRSLGRAVAALPSLAGNRVWLVTIRYPTPARWFDLVEVGLADGRATAHLTLPDQAVPVAVLPSGVLTRSFEDDLQVVEPGSGRVRVRLARAATFVDARGDRVAWLAGRDLHVRDLASGAAVTVPPPAGSPGWHALGGRVRRAGCCYALGAFAPDGRTLAVYTRVTGPRAPGLAVVDVATGRAALLPGSGGAVPDGHLPRLAWASNGWLYFFADGPAVTSIGAWRPGERSAALLRLDLDQVVEVVPSTLAAN
jgi:hypothetical protein